MSKHNYSQYSKKDNQNNQKPVIAKTEPETVVEEVKMEPIKPANVKPVETSQVVRPSLVHETVETKSLPDKIEGFVINCAKLNVRENATANAPIVCVLNAMSEIKIDVNRSSDKWVYVYTASGAEGYCMREYIDAHL